MVRVGVRVRVRDRDGDRTTLKDCANYRVMVRFEG